MTIVLTGGGSGGHITPILAVAAELKRLRPDIRLVYIAQKGDPLNDVPASHPAIDNIYFVRAGKFRRYNNMGRLQRLLDFQTLVLNLRDLLYIAIGTVQSYLILGRLAPSVIFTRGGYLSVPVAVAGKLRHVPYITHDSDSTPSLANRLIARWAALHAVTMPEEAYPYPQHKIVRVGVPVSDQYHKVSAADKNAARQAIGLSAFHPVILLTGGGNGSASLNQALVGASPTLLATFPELAIIHVSGRALEAETNQAYSAAIRPEQRSHVRVEGFTNQIALYSAAADVVINRGGATNITEFAIQQKACIIVPAAALGWNVKNVAILEKAGAVIASDDIKVNDPNYFSQLITDLLNDPEKQATLGKNFSSFGIPDAAHRLAVVLLDIAEPKQNHHEIDQKAETRS